MARTDCRHFNGYKPCGKSLRCDENCHSFEGYQRKVLVVGLGAMGAVLRATSVLPAIVRKYPGAHMTWLTEKHSLPLLQNNPLIDRLVALDFSSLLSVSGESFDIGFVMDKDQRIGGILSQLKPKQIFGFTKVDNSLGIVPANPEAEELWRLGLSDQKKFFENRKPETQLLHESFALGPWKREPYVLEFDAFEKSEVARRRERWGEGFSHLIGINTGCSTLYPNKKLTVSMQRELIVKLQRKFPSLGIVLLGGPEDTSRNEEISRGLRVISSSTTQGLRDGLISTAAVDLVISGDSLGLHMGIALKKWCVAWFGPTCEQEIDLYDRGVKVLSHATCQPCWKRVCHKDVMCYDLVDINEIVLAVQKGLTECTSLSSKLHFLET